MGWSGNLLLSGVLSGGLLWILIVPGVYSISSSRDGCPLEFFECASGECLDLMVRCNGSPDCRDSSDEENCDYVLCKEPNWFKCENDRCVSKHFVCDGENDCGDFTDEKHCSSGSSEDSTHHQTCPGSSFQCVGNKACIPDVWACDGTPDCTDGSDEIQGCFGKTVCSTGFLCNSSHQCIPHSFRCDGEPDCLGGEDEKDCLKTHVSQFVVDACNLEHHKYLCKDSSKCVDLHMVCDHHRDCPDGSDEGGNCSDIAQCDAAKCGHDCVHTPSGAKCICPIGYYLNGTDCFDINECLEFGKCDHQCINSNHGYHCSCEPGYKLVNGHDCKVEDGEGLLLFSEVTQIRGLNLKSKTYFPVATHLSQVVSVAYDGLYVYWTNIMESEEAIVRSLKDGSDIKVILNSGLGAPEDLAVDLVTKNIYFTDPKMQHIGVCTNDGVACIVLHNKDIDKPRAITLQPDEGLMYWTDWGKRPMIARSGMDGTEVTDFVSTNIEWPNGICIDHGNGRLYWVDAKALRIESIKLDGTDRRVINSDAIQHPFSIAVFEDSLYWSDFEGMEIKACNKFTGKNVTSIVRESQDRIFGIHIFHETMKNRNNIINPCEDSGCSDMCLLAPKTRPLRYSCACPEDKTLAPNGHHCNTGKRVQSIATGVGNTLVLVQHKKLGKLTTFKVKLDNVEKIGALAYDSLTGDLIISDSLKKQFFSMESISGHLTLLLSSDLGNVESMAVDPLGHNLYWVDSERLTVELLSLKTLERKILISDLGGETPKSIALAPSEGYMFIALSGPTGSHIDRFYMNGHARVQLVIENIVGPGIELTYDAYLKQLFFTDSFSGFIEKVDVDGLTRHKFHELFGTPTSIATLEHDVFWATHASPALEYASKFDEDVSVKQLILDVEVGWTSVKIAAITERIAAENHMCQNHNGGCSHFCLVSPKASTCGCPNGMTLKNDGLTCEKPIQCKGAEFHCKTGECIAESLRCNHKNDCPLGDDELDCSRYHITCAQGEYSCWNGEKCLEDHTKCDGRADCWDKSDEMNCNHQISCPTGSYQCGSGECLDMRVRCDRINDCKDSSDELGCQDATCDPIDQIRCNDGSCLPKSWECDGEFDCMDGSDEHSGCAVVTCSSGHFTCKNGRCVEHSLLCDGSDDCEDFSDEADCPTLPDYEYPELDPSVLIPIHEDGTKTSVEHHCREDEFKCDSQPGVCLPMAVKCNGTSECLRGEDETNCNACYNHEFQCVSNKRCILREWICDNTNDCGDNSDEDPAMCKFHNSSSPKKSVQLHVIQCSNFECKNRQQCLPYSQVCDGHPDCSDGSDEGGRCGKTCMNAGCQELCRETPYGPHCECPPGFQLMGDAKSCSDVDECKKGTYCSQYCSNTPGSYSCSCRYPDYMLREDKMSCKAKGPKMQYVFVLGNQIRYITQTYSLVGVIYNNRGSELRVSGLDVDARRKHVFWTSDLAGTLTRICLNKKDEIEVIKNLARPTRMSFDWVTENVYFIENYNQIKVCHFGIQKCAVIYTAKPGLKIDALVVDSLTRLMFWSEEQKLLMDHHNPKSGIKRADLAGNNLITIVDFDVQKITDIAVDSLHEVIYFLEAHHGKVDRATLNGTNRQTVFRSPDIPVEIGLFEEKIYWLVKGVNPQRQRELEVYGNIWHCGLSGSKVFQCDVLKISPKNMLGRPYQFRIKHEALQPEDRDPCKLVNCTHMCVLTQSDAACLCEDGLHVHPGQACKATNISKITFSKEEVKKLEKPKPIVSWWLLTTVIFLFIVLPTIAGFVYFMYGDIMRWCCRNKNNKFIFSSFHFHNNPSYGDGLSHTESSFHHNRLDPGQHQYENPMIGKLPETNISIVSSNEMNSISHPKKLEFHITDLQDDDTSSIEYSDTLTESHIFPLIQ